MSYQLTDLGRTLYMLLEDVEEQYWPDNIDALRNSNYYSEWRMLEALGCLRILEDGECSLEGDSGSYTNYLASIAGDEEVFAPTSDQEERMPIIRNKLMQIGAIISV